MAKVKVQVNYKDDDGSKFKQVLSWVNPECADADLKNFVNALSNLTTNQVEEVFKIVERFLSETSQQYITVEELQDIIDGKFTPVADDNPVSSQEIQDIVDGNYTPVEDDDALSADDFVF